MKNKITILFVLALITSSCELNETEEVLPKMSLEEMMQYETKQDKERRISMGFLLKKEVHLMFGDRGITYVKGITQEEKRLFQKQSGRYHYNNVKAIVEFEENNIISYSKSSFKLGSKKQLDIQARLEGDSVCDQLFDAMDANNDNKLSKEEWPFTEALFEEVDTNKDDFISKEEWAAVCTQ